VELFLMVEDYTPVGLQLPPHNSLSRKEIEAFYEKMLASIDLKKELMAWAKRIYANDY
jgi:hypothetical protein